MNINTIPILQNNDNETVTLIALPLQIFQQATQQQSIILEQNLLFKTLPDGTLVIDTNQLLNGHSNLGLTTIPELNVNDDKCIDNSEPLIFTIQQKSDESNIINEVEEIIKNNEIPIKEEKSKSKVRYLNSKLDVRKVGRPRKDGSKSRSSESNKIGPFSCRYCDKEFQKWLLYKRHEKSHINEKKYKCSTCPASFNILSNHILHLAIHNTEDPTCPECGKKFQRIASLKAHMMYHEKEETFYCEDCDILFNNEFEMNEHIKEHGQDKKAEITDNLQCKFCKLAFSNQSEFKKHMSEHNKMRSILQTPVRKKPRKTRNVDRKHVCNICHKAFQKRSQIERHLRVHSGEKPYICKICDRGFSQKGSLQIHMTRHTGIRPHKCALCQAKFSQKGNLRAHILKTHSIPQGGDNVFSCSECSCVFKRLGSLNGHMTRNHPKDKNSDLKYVMSQLAAMQGSLGPDSDILQQAIMKSDLPDVGPSRAEHPIVTYVTLADLGLDGNMRRYVIKQRKIGDIRWHLCSFCTKEFKKPSDLVRHLRVHTREKPYSCKFCNRSFAVKSTLTTHIKTHSKYTKVSCKYCYKTFNTWNSLNAHILKHTGQKQKCHICNKVFRTSSQLNTHVKMHLNEDNPNLSTYYKEPNSNLIMLQPIQITSKGLQPVLSIRKRPLTESGYRNRPYTCQICGGGFKKISHLKQHHIKHTGERPYKCHLCFRNFGSSSILKTHILTHNGSKPYQCVICQKNFTTNGSLKRHLTSHSNEKPYLCPYCFKDFRTILQCRKHMPSHKLDLNLQMETEEDIDLTNNQFIDSSKTNDLSFTNTLVENPFSLDPGSNLESPQKDLIDNPIPLITQTLRADESGTVVLPVIANQENLTQENMQEIEDTLNSQMLNIIGSENFVDSSTYINKINSSEPITTTHELVNTLSDNTEPDKPIEDNPFLYHQVIVNLNNENEQIPIFDNNGIDNILSQNESLFLTDLNSLNISESNNVLLQNQLIMLPSEIEEEMQTADLNTIDPNLHLKLNVMNGFLNTVPDNTIQSFEEDILPHLPSLPLKSIDTTLLADDKEEPQQDLITDGMDVTCNLCKVQFKTKSDLKLHQCLNFINVEMDNSGIVQSKDTDEQFDPNIKNITEEEFKKFVTQKEKSESQKSKDISTTTPIYRNQCTFCTKSFRKPSDLQRHLRTHTGERPFKCDACAKSFSLKSTLESHSKIHQGRKEFTCMVCNSLFATKGSLSVHMRLHTGVKPFKCPLCNLKFRTSGHRKAHLAVHYKALKTGKAATDSTSRKTKMSELLQEVENMINSNINDKQPENNEIPINISINETLQVDNIVLQSDEKPLMHFEIETNTQGQIINIKPTASNILFVDEASKKEVISTHVEFDEKTKMQIENFIRDEKQKQSDSKKRIKRVCEVCQKEFSTKYLLERHSKIHTGEKIFSCNYCTKTFNQKNALQAHVRTHLGSRPFSCPYCSNTFSQSGNLKTHIKRIHGNIKMEEPLQDKDTITSGFIVNDLIQTENFPS